MSPPPAPRKPSRPGDPEAFGAQLDELLKGLEAEEPGILRRGKTFHAQQQAKAGIAAAASSESAEPAPGTRVDEEPAEAPVTAGGSGSARDEAEVGTPADTLVDRQIEQQIDAAAEAAAAPTPEGAAPATPPGAGGAGDEAGAADAAPEPAPTAPNQETSSPRVDAGDRSDPGDKTAADAAFEHQLEDLLAQIKPVSAPDTDPTAEPTGPAEQASEATEGSGHDDLADLSAQLEDLMTGSQAGHAAAGPGDPMAEAQVTPPSSEGVEAAAAREAVADTAGAEAADATPQPVGESTEAEVRIEELDDLLAGEPIEGDFESIEDLAESSAPEPAPVPEGASGDDVAAELDTQPEASARPQPAATRASAPGPAEHRGSAGRHARRALAALARYSERGAYHGCRLVNSPLARLAPAQRTAVGWIGLLTLFNGTLIVAFALLT